MINALCFYFYFGFYNTLTDVRNSQHNRILKMPLSIFPIHLSNQEFPMTQSPRCGCSAMALDLRESTTLPIPAIPPSLPTREGIVLKWKRRGLQQEGGVKGLVTIPPLPTTLYCSLLLQSPPSSPLLSPSPPASIPTPHQPRPQQLPLV